MKRWLAILIFLAIIFASFEVFTAVSTRQNTGLLTINSADLKATITLKQAGFPSINVGQGKAKVWLKPGTYTVLASDRPAQAAANVQIKAGKSHLVQLNPASAQTQPTSNYSQANELIKLLPYIGPNHSYTVTYKYNYSGSAARPVIEVYANTSQAKKDALAWLAKMGYKAANLPIQYPPQGAE